MMPNGLTIGHGTIIEGVTVATLLACRLFEEEIELIGRCGQTFINVDRSPVACWGFDSLTLGKILLGRRLVLGFLRFRVENGSCRIGTGGWVIIWKIL